MCLEKKYAQWHEMIYSVSMLNGQEKISDVIARFPRAKKVLAKFGLTLETEAHFHFQNLAHAAIMHKLSLRQILEELGKATGEKIMAPKVEGIQAPLKPGFRHGTPSGIRKTIAVHSGKGGVGKTFVAVNLAFSLAKKGYRVGLLDSDIDCPNVMEVLKLHGKLQADAKGKILPLTWRSLRSSLRSSKKLEIKVVSMAPLLEKNDQPLMWRGPIISRVIEQFVHDVSWGELDYLVVDLPAGTGDAPLTLLNILESPSFLVVTTSQDLAVLDAKKSLHMAKKFKIPILGIVENMSGAIFGKGGGAKIAAAFNTQLLATIELQAGYSKLAKNGEPAVLRFPKLAKKFEKIIEELALTSVAS